MLASISADVTINEYSEGGRTMKYYPGSKGGMGVHQQIISLMPPHRTYVEAFLGGGTILETKKPALINIAIDLDADLIRYKQRHPLQNTSYVCDNAISRIPSLILTMRDLVYCDPPYHPDTRTRKKIYKHELVDADHSLLLAMLQSLTCMVMISGYRCPLYDHQLTKWRRHDFQAATRGGPRTESVWMNYNDAGTRHDPRFLGRTFRERERIKRRALRWHSRFLTMPADDRAAIRAAIEDAEARLAVSASPKQLGGF